MELFPAIDLRDGKAVRLFQGDYQQMTVYSDSPAAVAAGFEAQGARNLHLVDLDGARDGRPANFETIKTIREATRLFVEAGGGIRDERRICDYLELGVDRVILGTAAVRDFSFLTAMVKKYQSRIAVGVDVKEGLVAVSGWEEVTAVSGREFCRRLADIGVETVIYTDIARDGALSGTNLAAYESLREIPGLKVIASGGISFEWEIEKLAAGGTYGAILGKALYSGKLDLARCLALAAATGPLAGTEGTAGGCGG